MLEYNSTCVPFDYNLQERPKDFSISYISTLKTLKHSTQKKHTIIFHLMFFHVLNFHSILSLTTHHGSPKFKQSTPENNIVSVCIYILYLQKKKLVTIITLKGLNIIFGKMKTTIDHSR